MTHAVDYARLQTELRELLQQRFEGVEILSVHIDEDMDFGDRRCLEMTVTFDGTEDALVRGRPAGLTSILEKRLAEMREAAFPIINFVPSREQRAS